MRYWRKGQRADIKTDLEKPDAAQWPSVTVTLGGLGFNPRLGHVKDWDPLPPKVYLHFFDIFISQLLTARLLRQKIWRKRMMMFQVCFSCNMNVRYYCFCVFTHITDAIIHIVMFRRSGGELWRSIKERGKLTREYHMCCGRSCSEARNFLCCF